MWQCQVSLERGRAALGKALRRVMDLVVRWIGIARRRLEVAVAEQLPDYRQSLAGSWGTVRQAAVELVQWGRDPFV